MKKHDLDLKIKIYYCKQATQPRGVYVAPEGRMTVN